MSYHRHLAAMGTSVLSAPACICLDLKRWWYGTLLAALTSSVGAWRGPETATPATRAPSVCVCWHTKTLQGFVGCRLLCCGAFFVFIFVCVYLFVCARVHVRTCVGVWGLCVWCFYAETCRGKGGERENTAHRYSVAFLGSERYVRRVFGVLEINVCCTFSNRTV